MSGYTPLNKRLTIRAGKPRRNSASLTATNLGTTAAPKTFFAWGKVHGQSFGVNGDDWFFGPQKIDDRWHTVYIPRVDLDTP